MPRVIVEAMYYQHPQYRSIYSAGTRVSCDDGQSWITAGKIVIDGEVHKQISMTNREVDQAEFFRRVSDFETLGMRLDLTFIPPQTRGDYKHPPLEIDHSPSIARMN